MCVAVVASKVRHFTERKFSPSCIGRGTPHFLLGATDREELRRAALGFSNGYFILLLIFKDLLISSLCVYECFACMDVCTTNVPGSYRGQKRALGSLELELLRLGAAV